MLRVEIPVLYKYPARRIVFGLSHVVQSWRSCKFRYRLLPPRKEWGRSLRALHRVQAGEPNHLETCEMLLYVFSCCAAKKNVMRRKGHTLAVRCLQGLARLVLLCMPGPGENDRKKKFFLLLVLHQEVLVKKPFFCRENAVFERNSC
ncbi:hypothetical protein SAMN02745702_00417 [Desulfobaculum bizertense DSM 18034]|uniref:Uncharacterized protein n=1 Tax=Desulfobaculum bizertense DSM 18034 TaxID=1121442 RepID=A0A1T4VIR4_9BACT|nr:hypothetical protein SAMN02745702_00417 [Desulfobaculum bizertense DSM 18034]